MSVKRVTPREAASTRRAREGLFSRMNPLMFLKRLGAREVRPALVAAVFLRLVMNILLVFPHVPQL